MADHWVGVVGLIDNLKIPDQAVSPGSGLIGVIGG